MINRCKLAIVTYLILIKLKIKKICKEVKLDSNLPKQLVLFATIKPL